MKACNAIIQTPRPHRPRHREGRGLGTHALKAVTSRAALPLKGKPRKNRILAEPRASAVVLKVHGLCGENSFPRVCDSAVLDTRLTYWWPALQPHTASGHTGQTSPGHCLRINTNLSLPFPQVATAYTSRSCSISI